MNARMLLALLMALSGGSAGAASDTKLLTGAQCVPQTTSKWAQTRVAATGLTNQSTELPLAVTCALPVDGNLYQNGSLRVYLRAGSIHSTVPAYCTTKGGVNYETRYSLPPAGGTGVMRWDGTISVDQEPIYLSCYLPPGFRIGLIKLTEPTDTAE